MAYLIAFLLFSFFIESRGKMNLTEYEMLRQMAINSLARPTLAYPTSLSILFIAVTLIIGIFIRTLMLRTTRWLPYRVVMFAIGGIAGFCANKYEDFRPIVNICYTDVDFIMLIFLPLLMFDISYNIDFHSFWRCFPQILLVGVPGCMITALLMTFMAYYLIKPSWDFSISLLFGITSASIYPMEVVQELKTMSKGKYLSVLLLGEGLIGDITVLIAFRLVFGYTAMAVTGAKQISIFLIRYAGGGLLLGLVMGKITSSLLSLTYNDSLCVVTISISFAYLAYYIGEKYLYVSGLLSLVVVGLMTSKKKAALAVDVELMLLNFWGILAHVANTLIFTMVGVVIFDRLSAVVTASQIAKIFVTYATMNIDRLLVYAMLMPLLKRMGYGMTWYHCLVCVWGGLKGPISLCLALTVLETPAISDTSDTFVVQIAGVVILSLLINATMIKKVLKILGLGEISLVKKANMTNCVKRIMNTRDRCIAMLKMDKFLADANWHMVHDGTSIKHPYRIQIANCDDDDDDNYMGYRYTTCPECEREIPNEPTKKEFVEMMREANQRVFKAMKISYWRQYEHGKISKDGVKILVQAVDVAADSEDGRINLDALEHFWKPKPYAIWLRKYLLSMISTQAANAQIPHQPCRQYCYRIITNFWFDVFIYFVILLNTPVILFEVCSKGTFQPWVTNTIKGLNLFFYAIYFCEMVMKMIALGIGGYFKSHWNKLDFCILVVATGDLGLDIVDTFSNWDKWGNFNTNLVTATKLLRMLRFLRLFRLARISVPKMMAYLDRLIDIQLAFGYDVGKGFVTGEQEVINVLPLLVDNIKIQDMLTERLETDRLAVTRQLGLLQRDRPWTAITVKTRQATTSTLNIMLLDAAALKEEGFLDETEYKLLVNAIQEKVQMCRHHGNLIAPSSPETQLRSVSWLQSHQRIADYLLENSEMYNYNIGDILISRGDEPKGLYVIVSGLLEANYEPPDSGMDEAIPNYDFFTDLKFNESCQEYIVSGNAIGVIGVLTNRPYCYTVRCESAVQAYYIEIQVIQEAFKLAPHPIIGLRANMWREIGIKLALVILPTVTSYHSWSCERLSLRLENAFVPCLKAFKMFVVNDMMEDLLLLDGVCQDLATKEIFKPPCYIPRTVHRLVFPLSSLITVSPACPATKLLIIPAKDADQHDIMQDEVDEGQCELVRWTVHRLVFPLSSLITVSPACPATKLLIIPAKDADQHDIMQDEVDEGQCELISNVSSRCLYHQVVRHYSTDTWTPARRGRRRRRGQKRVNIQNNNTGSLATMQSDRNFNEKFYKTEQSSQSLGYRAESRFRIDE